MYKALLNKIFPINWNGKKERFKQESDILAVTTELYSKWAMSLVEGVSLTWDNLFVASLCKACEEWLLTWGINEAWENICYLTDRWKKLVQQTLEENHIEV